MDELKSPGGLSAADPFERWSAPIETTRSAVATPASVALALLNWQIGHLIGTEILRQQRAEYVVARRELGPRRDDEDDE
ncbi:hypothetical protein ACIHAX_07740 [Nocardia sp. NPDC051929]|uniref:hypothetical protein n=1 Tax=Nocardia sp. NPDC051929 TaxID=3364327 RepID=UPI0037C80B41